MNENAQDAYDLLAVLLADPNDTDELAMPIFTVGKTSGFNRKTFTQAFIQPGVPFLLNLQTPSKSVRYIWRFDYLVCTIILEPYNFPGNYREADILKHKGI